MYQTCPDLSRALYAERKEEADREDWRGLELSDLVKRADDRKKWSRLVVRS